MKNVIFSDSDGVCVSGSLLDVRANVKYAKKEEKLDLSFHKNAHSALGCYLQDATR